MIIESFEILSPAFAKPFPVSCNPVSYTHLDVYKRQILFSFFLSLFNAQIKFKVDVKETNTWRNIYSLIDEKNKTIKVLDSAKYYVSMSGSDFGYFAIFGKKNHAGWSAIDSNENVLFQVYNTSFGAVSYTHLDVYKRQFCWCALLHGFKQTSPVPRTLPSQAKPYALFTSADYSVG